MNGLGPLLTKELLEQWRTRRFLVVAVVFVAFGIGSPFLARYTPELIQALGGVPFEIEFPEPTARDAVDQFLKNLGQVGILSAILLAMGSIATEKERGTAALLLSKPASRAAYLAAKLVAMTGTLTVATLLASAAAYVYTALLFDAPSVAGWSGMTALMLLSLLAYLALTFLGSALSRSAVVAAAIGIAGMVGLAIVAALPNVAPYLPAGISGAPARALAVGLDPGPLIGPIAANVALVVALAVVAWLAFRSQEL